METRQQQELYSSVLGDGVVEWGPGEEWVNTATLQGLDEGTEGTEGWHGGRLSLNGDGLMAEDSAAAAATAAQGKMSPAAAVHGGSGCRPPAEEEEEDTATECRRHAYRDVPPRYVSRVSVVTDATWDMQLQEATEEGGRPRPGFLDSQPLREVDEDMTSDVVTTMLTEEEREEIYQELTRLEEEISTLRQVLTSKEKQHMELKQKLGITALSEFRSTFTRSWSDMQSSTAYKKTSETLSTAGQKTTEVFSTLGCAITRKFGDMRSNSIGYNIRHSMSMPTMRNSPSFKSFEEKVESTVTNIKTKVGGTGTGGGGSFEEVLSSAAQASAQDTPTSTLTDSSERPC